MILSSALDRAMEVWVDGVCTLDFGQCHELFLARDVRREAREF